MSQLGERLRAAREGQGIALGQASIETRILQRYLVALEDGDYQHLPGDVYARGFIRNYADYLGLSSEELIDIYRRERGVTDQIRVVPATSSPRIRGFSLPSFGLVFFVVLALVGLSYLALNMTGNFSSEGGVASVPTRTVPPPSPLATSQPAPPDGSLAEVLPTSVVPVATVEGVAGGAPTATPPSSPTPAAPIVGEVRIVAGDNQGSWMRITLDGQSAFEGVLRPGESRTFTADRNILIRVGNAGVVSVIVNGQEFGPLGNAGQVIDFPWPPQ